MEEGEVDILDIDSLHGLSDQDLRDWLEEVVGSRMFVPGTSEGEDRALVARVIEILGSMFPYY